MAERKCLTPDAIFSIRIDNKEIGVNVRMSPHTDRPLPISLTEEEAKKLEDDLHDAVEACLARYWVDPEDDPNRCPGSGFKTGYSHGYCPKCNRSFQFEAEFEMGKFSIPIHYND